MKNLAAFCPCLVNLNEATFKVSGISWLIGGISKQCNIHIIACLLLITLSEVLSDRREIHMQFGEGESMGKSNIANKAAEKKAAIKQKPGCSALRKQGMCLEGKTSPIKGTNF